MTSLRQRSEVGELFDRMTLGVVKTLERKPGVTDVRLFDKKPVDKSDIHSWEQKNSCFLPNDLKDFYLTTDGISIQWSIQFDDRDAGSLVKLGGGSSDNVISHKGGVLPVGKMEVNALSDLTSLKQSRVVTGDQPSLFDLSDLSDEEDAQGIKRPHFDEKTKCFELDSCAGFAKVCLVYKDIKSGVTNCCPEIWFLDRSLKWTFLASSFQRYFRMLIVHLGLPLWQYQFTEAGLSLETKQWFNMYAPGRLEDDLDMEAATNDGAYTSHDNQELFNQLDVTKVFKGKHDSVKIQPKQAKKKQSTSSNSKTNLPSKFGMSGFKPLYR